MPKWRKTGSLWYGFLMYKAGIPTTESAVLWAASAFLGACAGILGRKMGRWMLHEKESAVPELTSAGDHLTAALDIVIACLMAEAVIYVLKVVHIDEDECYLAELM